MSESTNLVDQFQDAFLKSVAILTEEDDIMVRNQESTQNSIDERIVHFTDLARQLETYFIQKRFLCYNYKPEIGLKEDTVELKAELVRKDELIRKHYDRLQSWQAGLADVQGVQPSGAGQVRPQSGQQPPGGLSGPMGHQPGPFPAGAIPGSMTRMPGPMYGSGSGQSLQGPLAHLERTTSSIGGPLGGPGGGPMGGSGGGISGMGGGMMMGGNMMGPSSGGPMR